MQISLVNSLRWAEIDDEDFELVNQYRWYISNKNYAYTFDYSEEKKKHILMHRLIMGFPDKIVDHKDRNTLNNCKNNLRVATPAQNTWNYTATVDSSSGYRGVYFIKSTNKWKADIMVNGERLSLGYFYKKEDAAKARDVAAIEHYGEYAALNFPHYDYSNHVVIPDMEPPTSQYKGVNYNKRVGKWTARIQFNNKRILIGEFFSEVDAAMAQDLYVVQNGLERPLNFPHIDYSQVEMPETNRRKKSSLWGVSPRNGRFIAKLRISKQDIHIGIFDTEKEAALAYDKYIRDNKLSKPLNFGD